MRQNNNIKPVVYYGELLELLAQVYVVLVKTDNDLANRVRFVLETCDSSLLFRS